MHVTTQDVQFKGSEIQLCTISYSHVDPQIWRNPLEFRPERWEEKGKREGYCMLPGMYMPYSVSELPCAGRFLAEYEGPLILAEIYH